MAAASRILQRSHYYFRLEYGFPFTETGAHIWSRYVSTFAFLIRTIPASVNLGKGSR